MAKLRVKEAAEKRGVNLSQLYQAINTTRAQRGEKFAALGTVRRYWHSTENGSPAGDELDLMSWSFLQEVARTIGASVYDLLPTEDGLGNTMPMLRKAVDRAA